MNDGPRAQGGEAPTAAGAKPSIAEVAAWLRRAAEQRDLVEELGPVARRAPEPPGADKDEQVEGGGAPDAAAGGQAPPDPDDASAAPAGRDEASVDPDRERMPVADAPPASSEPGEVGAAAGDEAADDEVIGEDEVIGDEPEARAAPPEDEAPGGDDGGPTDPAAEVTENRAGTGPDQRSDLEADLAPASVARTIAPDGEPTPDDPGLREGSEPEANAGPAAVAEPSASGLRPFVSGGVPAGPAAMAIGTSPGVEEAVDVGDDDEQGHGGWRGETTIAVANGAPGQQAGVVGSPPAEATEQPAAVVGVEQDVRPVEALVQDDLALSPQASRPEARSEAAPAANATDEVDEGGPMAEGAPEGPREGPERWRPAPPGGAVSLFDLDLAELAARARAAGERDEKAGRDEPAGQAEPDPWRQPTATVEVDQPGPALVPDVDEGAAAPADFRLTRNDGRDQGHVAGDVVLDEETDPDPPPAAAQAPAPKAITATALAMANAALQRRRTKRKRYPRGQLKERIGVLRRVRAMLGVVVLTVVLGVAAGAAIGAFLVFVAFALRNAITSG